METRCIGLGVALAMLTVGCHKPRVNGPATAGLLPNQPLVAMGNGAVIYDRNLRVYWLANANLASDPAVVAQMNVSGIRANGTMTYRKALEWVAALNRYNNNAGYLGHNNWQLPTTPRRDDTCAVAAGVSGNSFGPGCMASALGALYHLAFRRHFPDGIIDPAVNSTFPIRNLQQGLHWTSGESPNSAFTPTNAPNANTYAFTTNEQGQNTTRFNYFHVLPMVRGVLPNTTPPSGTGLVPYANGLAVYDTEANVTWALDAQLAATQAFGISGLDTLPTAAGPLVVPRIARSGMMRFETARAWLRAMNLQGYANSDQWILPSVEDLQGLYNKLELQTNPAALLARRGADPFVNIQRFFYWSCQSDPLYPTRCSDVGPGPAPNGNQQMQWAFNFQSGFQGTAKEDKEFFVTVYFRPRDGDATELPTLPQP